MFFQSQFFLFYFLPYTHTGWFSTGQLQIMTGQDNSFLHHALCLLCYCFHIKNIVWGGGVGLNAKQLNFDREAVEER